MGVGIYRDSNEAFASLDLFAHVEPDTPRREEYMTAYNRWKEILGKM